MIERVNIASAPIDEPCVQVSQTEDYLGWMRKECAAFKNQLERMTNAGKFGAPGNAGLMIISQHHDFGMYSEVYVGYSTNDAVGEEYAYEVEGGAPMKWDDEAKKELGEEYFEFVKRQNNLK